MKNGVSQSFLKNLENFSTITNEENTEIFCQKLENLKIEIILQENPKNKEMMKNNILTCNILLNLLDRFLPHIRYVGNQEILHKYFLQSFSQNILLKTFEGEPTLSIIIGNEKVDAQDPIYITSSGWSVFLSRNNPSIWKTYMNNPLSAIYIAALTACEIFKLIIADYVFTEIKDEFIYDFITHGYAKQPVLEPPLPSHLDLNLTLLGCGSVGQVIAFALNQFDLRGKIILIDPDILDESNKQRYLLAFDENIGVKKTEFLSRFLMDSKNPLLVTFEIFHPYEIAITINNSLYEMEDVFVSVDNRRTRVNLQAILPKMIWNVWTDTANETLRYGIGKHDFRNEYQCLACAYYPEGNVPTQTELNAVLLGMSQDEITKRLDQNDLITNEDLEYLFNNFTVPSDQVNRLKNLVGRPFSEIFHGECGVFTVRLLEKHEPTPATYIPVIAGVYAVIQFVLTKLRIGKTKLVESIAEFDGFLYPSENCLIKKKRNPNCVCNDPIYQEVYRKKWT